MRSLSFGCGVRSAENSRASGAIALSGGTTSRRLASNPLDCEGREAGVRVFGRKDGGHWSCRRTARVSLPYPIRATPTPDLPDCPFRCEDHAGSKELEGRG